tara:strand:- start:2054 stop:2392 length:339 start_codon:yes stop_codon:yes gene_type:complete
MTGNPSYNKKVITAHSSGDRSLELALALGMSHEQFARARLLMISVSKHRRWRSQRSPHGLMIDCVYLVAKSNGIKTSAEKIVVLTREIFGIGTQPLPNKWKKDFVEEIEEYV